MGVSEVSAKTRRAVFLDRDGVLNEVVLRDGKPYPPARVDEMRLMAGVEACLRDLKLEGFLLIIVTNQPDVARGTQTRAQVEQMHAVLIKDLPIDDSFICYHDDTDQCSCRKPKPGLMLEAAKKYGIELTESFLIGDRWRDVDAGNSAKCKTLYINYGYQERRPATPATFETDSLRGAVDWILKQ
jgi:D-glycero-D-manno-heptose 1,7-bisphosphate phosphatase